MTDLTPRLSAAGDQRDVEPDDTDPARIVAELARALAAPRERRTQRKRSWMSHGCDGCGTMRGEMVHVGYTLNTTGAGLPKYACKRCYAAFQARCAEENKELANFQLPPPREGAKPLRTTPDHREATA
ncbi:hypothetical protein [Streptomyces profundus]|uniref:hypothetical protein n=1 Tax=Streptomyces profundus TaxID=2867410 RepID=UPI001D16DF0A|nr:hypothetical protein [Streptomyces sp. MA3_2.13]UED86649.1 hypothetical protein K4G22_22655 [Streptomyces sp. MA3_2.13]